MQDPRQPGPDEPAPSDAPSDALSDSPGKSFDKGHSARRLHELTTARLETDEQLVAWERAWVSRDGTMSSVFAARTRDFAVLTDRRLMLWSTGFFTRRPPAGVLTDRLDDLTVEDIGRSPQRTLRVRAFARRPLRFEFGRRGRAFGRLLLEGAANATPAPAPEVPPEDAPWRP